MVNFFLFKLAREELSKFKVWNEGLSDEITNIRKVKLNAFSQYHIAREQRHYHIN